MCWQFQVGTYWSKVEIANPESLKTEVVIPEDAVPGQTIHLMLEATDQGTPALTRYQRVILQIKN